MKQLCTYACIHVTIPSASVSTTIQIWEMKRVCSIHRCKSTDTIDKKLTNARKVKIQSIQIHGVEYVQVIWQRATKHISLFNVTIEFKAPQNAKDDFSVGHSSKQFNWILKQFYFLLLTTWRCTLLNHGINEFGELDRLKTASNHRHRNRIMGFFAFITTTKYVNRFSQWKLG